ncbi:MAG TPA: SDR family NAD(P)-dependent oxidoreductase, partial [Capillimicrobium sp.]|nr:SDR family NAD(P)-dependent oxidoreductase [Capillimicrobium sp.]
IAAELVAGGPVEVGRRDGRRITVEPVAEPLDGRPDGGLLDDGAVLLVTGGARGITAAATIALARACRPTVVLVGRTGLTEENPRYAAAAGDAALKQAVIATLRAGDPGVTPATVEREYRRLLREREVRATVAALEEAGARVEVRPCDVRDADALAAIVEDVYATHGRIDGVIHGAGVIEDKLVADKELDSFERVLATKVTGATVLARTLRPDGLRFLVFFSSVSGRFGNRGQADYAAASEALDKLAQHLDRRWPARVVAVEWGPWLTTGMVSPAVRRQFAERGVALIDVETGCRMLEEELRFGRAGEAEVVIGGTTGFDPPARPAAASAAHATPPRALLAADAAVTRAEPDDLELRRTFDLARDRYLTDHRLDGRPVVPFAVATELMAEAAAAAAPGRRVAEVADIRVLSGLEVPDGGLEVRVRASAIAGAETGTLDLSIAATAEPRRLRYRARAALDRPVTPDPPPAEPLAGLPPFPMTVAEAYERLLFHGPLFQGIVAIEGMDERGLRAVLRPTPPERALAVAAGERWWMDPITVDCALQLQVIWARLAWDVTLLPASIGSVRPVAPLEGEAIGVELRVRPESRPPLCHVDHVFTAPGGRVLGRLTDVVGTGSKVLNRLATAGAAS